MTEKKKIIVLTGAGISAESGIKTFRDSDGLWENHHVQDVATPEAWKKDKELVTRFYNQRRSQLTEVKPNAGHLGLVELEEYFDVTIITQNVDDLHERAGSTKIIHLHGELTKVRSSINPDLVFDWGYKEVKIGDMCEDGSQLRPHIVWFGEAVPKMGEATLIARKSDIFILIGSSMVVYPAAGLITEVHNNQPKYIIDPQKPAINLDKMTTFIAEPATIGVPKLIKELKEKYI
ncbi:MAG: NAD-dependent deacylase [Bacteroidetes bacterium]|nr:MAG: NAD-dependent deacylase [Bacteroidota bacterium]TAG89353.1 MAG: NAD-dependent deacylase [Bacteroidota bacterium]